MKLLTRALVDELALKAAASPRARAHHNIHAAAGDPVQRFLVAAMPGSYFRPHRHRTRAELAWVVRGRFDVLTFDDRGCVSGRCAVGGAEAILAYETPADTWHTLIPGESGGVFLEIKEGPYDPATAAEFAPWSPAEATAPVPEYLAWLRRAQPGERPP